MACEIEVAGIDVVPDAGGAPLEVRIVGTSRECNAIIVSMECPGAVVPRIIELNAEIRANGVWRVIVPGAILRENGCGCGRPIGVVARCAENPACQATWRDELRCCPEVSRLRATPDPGCAGQTRGVRVTFDALLRGGDDTELLWIVDPNLPPIAARPTSANSIVTLDHTYTTPGTFDVVLIAIRGGCRTSVTARIVIPPCCPRVTRIVPSIDGCRVTLIADTDVPNAAGSYRWDFGDGARAETTRGASPTHAYPESSTYTGTVVFQPTGDCPASSATVAVELPRCDGEKAKNKCGWMKDWLTFLFALAFGVGLVIALMKLCLKIPIPQLVAGLAAGAAIAAGIVLALWLLTCRLDDCPCPTRCDLAEIAWASFLGAGLVGLYLWPCCPSLVFRGLVVGFNIAGLGLMLAWIRNCKPTECAQRLAQASVFGAASANVISALAMVPQIRSCGSGWVLAGLLVTNAVLIAAARGECK